MSTYEWRARATALTIDYTYDPLNRLTGTTYSDGRTFGYTYDPAGNVLELGQNLGSGTVTTTYNYDAANQLNTAQQGSTTWQYTYDANGSLITDGVKTYTYDSANRLIQVSDQSSVTSLSYNGLGQRLSMDAAGVIAHYVLDGDRPLTAESSGNTTFYLYGHVAIGEETNEWAYSLPDGTNTPRQLTNLSGDITLSARYTPWGDTLDFFGTGNFSFGYLGGVLDASTGLLYVGNGQYYDPSTGRFLTRDVNPNSPNPYVPWNPIGAIVGPLGLIALVFGRKKKGSEAGTFLVLLIVLGSVGMTLAACGPAPTPPVGSNNTAPTFPNQAQTPVPTLPGTVPTNAVGTPPAPIETPTPTPCPTPFVIIPSQNPINCDELSDIRARRACRTYLALRDHAGWWNGNQTGTLSPQAFVGLILRMEFSDSFKDVGEAILQETVVRNFYAHYYAWPDCRGDTRLANDMFCFIGAKQLLEIGSRTALQLDPTDSEATIEAKWKFEDRWGTANFESVFLNPPGAWITGIGTQEWVTDVRSPSGQSFVYTAPMDWGNISMFTNNYNEAVRLLTNHWENAEGRAEWQFYIRRGGGNTATIVTFSQREYWYR